MRINDEALFYHSQEGNCVMGRMKVIEEAHQDPTTTDPRWLSVTFEPTHTLKNPVPLAAIKSTPDLSQIALIRQPRLSVSKLTPVEFNRIVELGQ
jgi:predicted RNA-binding protein with PUA-like domain